MAESASPAAMMTSPTLISAALISWGMGRSPWSRGWRGAGLADEVPGAGLRGAGCLRMRVLTLKKTR